MTYDWKAIVADLSLLNEAVAGFDKRYVEQRQTFIRVGEYDLALDGIAAAYLDNKVEIPPDLFQVFEKLAVPLDTEKAPEYDSVAELRARMKARPGLSRAPG